MAVVKDGKLELLTDKNSALVLVDLPAGNVSGGRLRGQDNHPERGNLCGKSRLDSRRPGSALCDRPAEER